MAVTTLKTYLGAARTLAFSACVVAVFAACYVHTRAHMIEPVIKRPSLCSGAVKLFDARDDLTEPYVEIARLSVWWPADMVAHVRTVEDAMRRKAAKLGANGIIRGRTIGQDSIQPRYEGNVAGVAIFLPGDSARTADVCADRARQGAG